MKLTYIYHSGFAIEEERFVILIDYYRDTAGLTGYVHDVLLPQNKRMYVLSTHFHEDHFNPEILTWKERHPNMVYIFSKDIFRHRRVGQEGIHWLVKGGEFADENLSVRAFGSTDIGVSFFITTENHTYFHAGDLNNWHWNEESEQSEIERYEKAYLGELKDICKVLHEVDFTMFPVDERLGRDYMRGPQQFLEKVHSAYFIPMHFSAVGFDSANAFQLTAQHCGSRFLPLHHNGDSFTF